MRKDIDENMTANNQNSKELNTPSGYGPFGCKCQTLAYRVLGDGCDICNPELAKELEEEYKAQLEEDMREEENERLRF